MPTEEYAGLCHRCDHRATFLEKGYGPRCECKSGGSVCGCYMYRPVKPVIQRRAPGDRRPVFAGAMISARMRGVRVASEKDGAYYGSAKRRRGGKEWIVAWVPNELLPKTPNEK